MATEERDWLDAFVALLQAQAFVVDGVGADLVARRDMPLSWHEVLVRLQRSEGGAMRMQELAHSVLLSKSGLTRLADRMEHARLIERAGCATDRRGTFAVITPKGRRALRAASPVFLRSVQDHFARHLSAEEVRVLNSALRKLVGPSGQASAEDCEPGDAEGASTSRAS